MQVRLSDQFDSMHFFLHKSFWPQNKDYLSGEPGLTATNFILAPVIRLKGDPELDEYQPRYQGGLEVLYTDIAGFFTNTYGMKPLAA